MGPFLSRRRNPSLRFFRVLGRARRQWPSPAVWLAWAKVDADVIALGRVDVAALIDGGCQHAAVDVDSIRGSVENRPVHPCNIHGLPGLRCARLLNRMKSTGPMCA